MATKKSSKTSGTRTAPGPREASQEKYKEFIAAWNAADNRAAVAKKVGISEKKAAAWAARLRNKKVPLKKLGRSDKIDWNELIETGKKTSK